MTMTVSHGAIGPVTGSAGDVRRWVRARSVPVVLALGAVATALINLATTLNWVNWTAAQIAAVTAESAAVVGFVAALLAHLRLGTSKEPVALAATVTALLTATLALGSAFAWWRLTQEQNSAVVAVLASLVGLGTAALARARVTPE